ncbi:putative mitochondrial protein [Vitis vinifera]|uniref:Putative mitochondrial protein n=1 Tax=Vitis vinifera TaxID=29760 RepID=A0A438EZY7_VITVI|nr:putative mitochondrial protein [Vitis vinifera]
MGQGYEDHLVTQEADIPEVDRVQWRKIDAQLCSVLWQSVDPKILLHLRAYKTCFKFWNQAKGLYTNDIQRLYKVASSIVNVRQQDMDLSTYIGQIASLKEEFLTVMPLTTNVGDQRTQIDKFFMVLTLIGLRPNLETVRDQILGSSSVPSLDDVFARLLRISSTQTLPSDNTSDSSVLVSQTRSRGGRGGNRGRGQRPHCTYCNKLGHTRDRCYQLHGWPPRTATWPSQILSRLNLPVPPRLKVFPLLTVSMMTISAIRPPSQLLLPRLDRGTGKTIGIGRESQSLYHLTAPSTPAVCISTDAPLLIHSRLGHPSLSKFQKMVPSFSSLSSLACESYQLGKHTRVLFPKRFNNRTKSPFELVHTDTKDLGKLKYFLEIEIAQSSSGVVLSQRKYALDILEETGMLDCKPIDTPMDPNVKLIPGQGEPLGDPGRYRRLVGKLNYLTITRPDISFPVSVVNQFLQSPCDSHWDAVIRILRYIKSTPGQGVLYENRGHTQVVGYTDADWAGSPTDRRSTSRYCVFIGGNLISWKSKKQDLVARSSVEAEYRAMALATCELIWLKNLLGS